MLKVAKLSETNMCLLRLVGESWEVGSTILFLQWRGGMRTKLWDTEERWVRTSSITKVGKNLLKKENTSEVLEWKAPSWE